MKKLGRTHCKDPIRKQFDRRNLRLLAMNGRNFIWMAGRYPYTNMLLSRCLKRMESLDNTLRKSHWAERAKVRVENVSLEKLQWTGVFKM